MKTASTPPGPPNLNIHQHVNVHRLWYLCTMDTTQQWNGINYVYTQLHGSISESLCWMKEGRHRNKDHIPLISLVWCTKQERSDQWLPLAEGRVMVGGIWWGDSALCIDRGARSCQRSSSCTLNICALYTILLYLSGEYVKEKRLHREDSLWIWSGSMSQSSARWTEWAKAWRQESTRNVCYQAGGQMWGRAELWWTGFNLQPAGSTEDRRGMGCMLKRTDFHVASGLQGRSTEQSGQEWCRLEFRQWRIKEVQVGEWIKAGA